MTTDPRWRTEDYTLRRQAPGHAQGTELCTVRYVDVSTLYLARDLARVCATLLGRPIVVWSGDEILTTESGRCRVTVAELYGYSVPSANLVGTEHVEFLDEAVT